MWQVAIFTMTGDSKIHLSPESVLSHILLLRGWMVADMFKSHLDIKQQQVNRLTQNHSSYFKIRHADMSSSECILCKTRQWLACCLSSSLSYFLCVCLCFFFQMLRYRRTEKRRTGQTDAAGVVRPLWNAPALKRSSWELYCVGRQAAANSISPRCKASLQATTMSIFVEQHYYLCTLLQMTGEGSVSKSPFNELQVCACHKTGN